MIRAQRRLGFLAQAHASALASLLNTTSVSGKGNRNGGNPYFGVIWNRSLLPYAGQVVRTLNWNIVKKIVLSQIASKYGFLQAIQFFGILIAVFSSANMARQTQRLYCKIVDFHGNSDPELLGSLAAIANASQGTMSFHQVLSSTIRAFAERERLDEGVRFLRYSKKFELEIDTPSCNFLLKCLVESGKFRQVSFLFSEMKSSGPWPNIYTYNIMMNFFSKTSSLNLKKAREILSEMEIKDIEPNEVTYCSYLRVLSQVEGSESAWKFLREIICRRFPYNIRCFNTIIQGFCRENDLAKAKNVLRAIRELNLVPDLYSYSIPIDALCKNGDLIEALQLLEEMESAGIRPNLVIYSSILFRLCKIGQMNTASEIFNRIRNCGYDHDKFSYAIMIDGHSRAGNFHDAHDLMREMIEENQNLDVFHCNCLISGYCRFGFLDESLNLLNYVIRTGISPNLVTWTILADGFIKQDRARKGLTILNVNDHPIDHHIRFGVLINGLCKSAWVNIAWEVFKSMENLGIFPDFILYTMIIDGFIKNYRLNEAFGLFGRMLKHGITANMITYTCLINGLSIYGKPDDAMTVFKEMTSDGMEADVAVYTSLMRCFSRVGDMSMAWRMYGTMVKEGIVPDVVALSCLVDGFCKSNEMEKARFLVDGMRKIGVAPNVKTYSSLIYGYCRDGRRDEAVRVFQRMRDEGVSPDSGIRLILGLEIL